MAFGAPRRTGGDHTLVVERDRLLLEARIVGLGKTDTPTLEAVERRRIQLWTLAVATLMGVAAILLLGRTYRGSALDWSKSAGLQGLLVALVVGMAAYVADRERHLQVLTRLLVDERALTAALVQRLAEVRTLLGVAKAMNSNLGLDVILARIVDAATTMLYGEHGEILLTDGEVLRVVATWGDTAGEVDTDRPHESTPAGHAARTWELVAVAGDAEHAPELHVPILHASQILGVLSIAGHRCRPFSDYDRRAVLLFAEQAAFAIAAIHRAEASKWQEAERVELTTQRGHVVTGAVSDLRDPLSSLIAATKMLKRERLGDSERLELAEVISRQTAKLTRTLEEILQNQG